VVSVAACVQAARLVQTISIAIGSAPEMSAEPDPVANTVFDAIDRNGNDNISSAELMAYLLREFPSRVAHTLLRVLDTDNNGQIDRQEWQRGWKQGLCSQVLAMAVSDGS
jgi:Ca2+-binding EF-hand superfamily protein